jgi:hypothetical protein
MGSQWFSSGLSSTPITPNIVGLDPQGHKVDVEVIGSGCNMTTIYHAFDTTAGNPILGFPRYAEGSNAAAPANTTKYFAEFIPVDICCSGGSFTSSGKFIAIGDKVDHTIFTTSSPECSALGTFLLPIRDFIEVSYHTSPTCTVTPVIA